MAHRKTRKEKIKSQARRAAYFQELNKLKEQQKELEKKVEDDRIAKEKGFHIRNLKIFKDTCNVLLPYVICASISVGGIFLLQGGLPVKRDEIKKAKYTTLNIEEQGESPVLETHYGTYGIWASDLSSSTIILKSPWEEVDGEYIRYKRIYDITSNKNEIINLILEKDYKRLFEELSEYKEEIEKANYIAGENNGYSVEGNIYLRDNKDLITFPESTTKNVVITLLELILTLGIGAAVAWNRYFDYFDSIEGTNYRYHIKIETLERDLVKLEETNEKILALTRKGRI